MLRAELVQTTELINVALEYLAGDRSMEELETWVVEHLQEILDTCDPKTVELANEVDSLVIEKGEGLITEGQFKEALSKLIQRVRPSSSLNFNASHTAIYGVTRDFSPSVLIRVNLSLATAGADRQS